MMSNEKICVEKIHHTDINEHKSILNNKDEYQKQKLTAAFYSKKLWPENSTIKIKFLDNNPNILRTSKYNMDTSNGPIDPLQQYFFDNPNINIIDAVKKIVNERIQPLTSLQFQFVDGSEDSDVRISFDSSSGAWSLVGTDAQKEDKNSATMNLGWFDVSTVIHEFGHVLGMIHEHQNPRGQSIQWNDNAVFSWAQETQGWDKEKTKQNILDKYDINQINGSSFDPLSIMLYFFPANLTVNNKGTNQNLRLSGEDVMYITEKYGKSGQAKEIYENMYGENIETNIMKSNSILSNMNSGGNKNFYIIIYVLGIFLFLGLIFYFIKRKKDNQ
jgi:hypothetical protein